MYLKLEKVAAHSIALAVSGIAQTPSSMRVLHGSMILVVKRSWVVASSIVPTAFAFHAHRFHEHCNLYSLDGEFSRETIGSI
jgi:hypothetical protein